MKRVRHWDLAASEPDYTAGVLVGPYRDGRWVVLDVIADSGARLTTRDAGQHHHTENAKTESAKKEKTDA